MKRFEKKIGAKLHCWEIDKKGFLISINEWEGDKRQQKSFQYYSSLEEAQKFYENFISEKQVQGFLLVSPNNNKQKFSLKNETYENAIQISPETPSLYMDYGIWLQRNGEIRGDFISLFRQDPINLGQFHEFMAKFGKNLAGRFIDAVHRIAKQKDQEPLALAGMYFQSPIIFDWYFGYLRSVRLSLTPKTQRDWIDSNENCSLLPTLFSLESAKFLQFLTVGCLNFEGQNSYQNSIDFLAGQNKLLYLKGLFLGDFHYKECEISWSELGDAGKLSECFPTLKILILRSGSIELSRLEFPKLKKLILITGGLQKKALPGLKLHQCEQLTHLEIYLGTKNFGRECEIQDLEFIFEGELFKKVKYLGLKNAENQGEILKKIMTSSIIKQLEILDLSMGTLGDEELEPLFQHATNLKHLKKLDLSENYLSFSMQALKKLPCNIDTTGQKYASSLHERFVSIGE